MLNSRKFNSIYPPPSVISEDLKNAGTWWILSSIFSIVLNPLITILWFNTFIAGLPNLEYSTPTAVSILIIMMIPFLLVTPILQVIAYNYTMKLDYLDKTLKWGSLFGMIQSIMYLLGAVLLPFYSYTLSLTVLSFYIGSMIGFISIVLLVIGFFKTGEESDNTTIKIGSAILLFFTFIGGILIGYGLKQTAVDIAVFTIRKINWDKIKNDIKSKLENQEPIYIDYFARGNGLIPLVLKIKISEWISKEEIKGFLHRGIILPKED